MSAALRVGLLGAHNPFDRTSFSGTPFFMREALERRPDVTLRVLGPHRPPPSNLTGRVFARLKRRFPTKNFLSDGDLDGVDVIFATVCSELLDKLDLPPSLPKIFFTDATPGFLREFYSGIQYPSDIEDQERRILQKVDRVVYSCEYMRQRALLEFPFLDPARVHAFSFGANLEEVPAAPSEKPPLSTVNLLHIGLDWDRKGGAIALDVLRALRARGVNARLTLVGGAPVSVAEVEGVNLLGFINKNHPHEVARFSRELRDAHVFILPTRADCTPMVVSEANMHGIPVLITDVGGVSSLMNEGRNGRMLPLSATVEDWVQAVMALVADPEAYTVLSRSSFAHAQAHLTWDAWASKAVDMAKNTISLGD